MKQARKESIEILQDIEDIEDKISDLKLSVLKKLTPSKSHLVSLKGILKGIEISEQDIQKAQKSLYSRNEF